MPKKIPTRRCTGCGEMKDKKELIRVVRAPDGTIAVDRTGKMNGRGAYLCDNLSCLQKAQKKRSLQRSLSTNIPDEIFGELEKRWEVPQDG
ncbi:MAG TPA: DUF448 domain-containing protein [Lachnospiraceae bacterium]|nr:DUF448 domain-containing protein [Lachnospiraceae bacterium]